MFDRKRHFVSELFKRNQRDLLTYLRRRMSSDDASDLLQETFVRVLRYDQFETIIDPSAFLKQTAINLTRDFARRRKVETSYLKFGDLPADAPSDDVRLDERLEAGDESRLLSDAFDALPRRRREVLALHLHENLPLDEIASRLKISDRMVRKHLSLALRSCRTALLNSPK